MNVIQIQKYFDEFFERRITNYRMFYDSEYPNRKFGFYLLKHHGSELLDFLHSIMGNIEEKLIGQIIPQNFVTVDSLRAWLIGFKEYLNSNQSLLDLNKSENTDYKIIELQRMKDELIELIDYITTAIDMDMDQERIPFLRLKDSLIENDVPEFINIIKSLLASISYSIDHSGEGYLHSNIHLLLKVLGFEIISEDPTNKGRIDAVIKLPNIIYIIEFKLGSCQDALQQIKDKKYHEKYLVERKTIIAIGVNFNTANRNIEDFISEEVYKNIISMS